MKPKTKKTAKTRQKAKSRRRKAVPASDANKGGRPQSSALVLGVAESMAQAAELTKWPEAVLKQMKKAGAPGFRFSRVYFAELIPWIGQRGIEDASIDWSERLKKAQAQREEIRLEEDRRRMVDREEIVFKAQRSAAVINANLDRVFRSELPAVTKGMDELSISKINGEAVERFQKQTSEAFDTLARNPGDEAKEVGPKK